MARSIVSGRRPGLCAPRSDGAGLATIQSQINHPFMTNKAFARLSCPLGSKNAGAIGSLEPFLP
jgi:hypothetical protein